MVNSRGAGLENVVLTRFKAADGMGRPEDLPLQLVPDDSPSFVLDQINDEQHVLRDLEWTVVSRQTEACWRKRNCGWDCAN